MKTLGRWLVVYLAFTMEVQIHAASYIEANQSGLWIREPQNCHLGSATCAVFAKQKKMSFSWGEQAVAVSAGSALWWPEENSLRLVQGSMSIQLNGKHHVLVPYGKIGGTGLALVERLNSVVQVTALNGELEIWPLESATPLVLPSGFRVTMGPVDRNGHVFDIPQAANPTTTLKQWWRLYAGSKSEFLKEARSFVVQAASKAELAGEWHQKMVERELASLRESERLAAQRRAAEEKERAKMRAMFRKFNYIGQELPE